MLPNNWGSDCARSDENPFIYHLHSCACLSPHPIRQVVARPNWLGLFWKGSTGFISKGLLKSHLPPPSSDSMVLVCGPPGMMEAVSGNKAKPAEQGELKGALKELGYSPEGVYKF